MSASTIFAAPAAELSSRPSVLSTLSGFFASLAHQARVRRDNARLAQLDDHMLSDLGLLRSDVVRLAGNDDQPALRISGTPY